MLLNARTKNKIIIIRENIARGLIVSVSKRVQLYNVMMSIIIQFLYIYANYKQNTSNVI